MFIRAHICNDVLYLRAFDVLRLMKNSLNDVFNF